MIDETAAGTGSGPICSWCSSPLETGSETACPTCGATLIADTEPQLPGVTAIDAEAIIRNARSTTPRRRNRLLSWISGEYDEGEGATTMPPSSISRPPPEVQREIQRLAAEARAAEGQRPEPDEADQTEEAESRGEVAAEDDGEAAAVDPVDLVQGDPGIEAEPDRAI